MKKMHLAGNFLYLVLLLLVFVCRAEATGVMVGEIRDETDGGSLIQGATVTCSGCNCSPTTQTTGADGSLYYTWDNSTDCTLKTSASKEGYYSNSDTRTISAGQNASVLVYLTQEPRKVKGTITVGGSGLSNVKVSLTGGTSRTDYTSSSGYYSFDSLTNGSSYTVTPSLNGYTFSPTSASGTVTGTLTHNFTAIPDTYTISGTIKEDGSGKSGVTVTLSGDASASTTTDANGDYSFSGIDHGTSYTVTPSLVGYNFSPSSASDTLTGPADHDFTAALNTYTISGYIKEGETAISGVTVTLSGDTSATTSTNSSGLYTFSDIPHGTSYTVTPSSEHASFDPGSLSGTLTDSTQHDFGATVDKYSVMGVITEDGSPKQGVTVSLLMSNMSGTTVTNSAGQYICPSIPYGTKITLTPTLSDYAFSPSSVEITVTENTMQNFTATPGHTISGTITENGHGRNGVTVTLSGGASETTTTDTSGNYAFPVIAAGTSYTVTPSLSSNTFSPTNASGTLTDDVVLDFTTALKTYAISGKITVGGTGKSGVTVTLSGATSATTTTDANGNYSLTGQHGYGYLVTPTLTGYTFSPSSVNSILWGPVEHDFTAIPDTFTISGTITESGAGKSGVTVALSGGASATTTTDGSGSYSFADIAYDTSYQITPTFTSYSFSPASASGTVTGATTHDFTAAFSTYTISGKITEEGSGKSGVTVALSGGANGNTTTDDSGNYSFSGIAHGTSYTVTPSFGECAFVPTNAAGTLTANTAHNFAASCDSNTRSIVGRVTENSVGKSGVTLTLSGATSDSTITDVNGNYSFVGIDKGTNYTLTPSLDGYAFTPTRTSGTLDESSTHNFTAEVASEVSGKVLQNSQPVAGAVVLAYSKLSTSAETRTPVAQTVTNENGEYEFSLADGEYEFVAEKQGVVLKKRTAEVLSQDQTGVDLSIEEISTGTELYTWWNGFFSMTNVLEITNKSADSLSIAITVYGKAGAESSRLLAVEELEIAGNSEKDVVLNDVVGITADSYGLLKIKTNHSDFDGRLTLYAPDKQQAGSYDFVQSIPFSLPTRGNSFVVSNTIQPTKNEDDIGELVANWLSIANLEETAKNFQVKYYSDLGELLETRDVEVASFARVDLEGGHVAPGPNKVALLEIIPGDSVGGYFAALNRYGLKGDPTYPSGYRFSVAVAARSGNGSVQFLPASNLPAADSYLELANVLDEAVTVELSWHGWDGSEVESRSVVVWPKSQVHVNAGEPFAENTSGVLKLSPNKTNSILAAVGRYYFEPSTGSVENVDYTMAKQAFGKSSYGSFNLYLGMSNWLRVINTTDSYSVFTVTLRPGTSKEESQMYFVAGNGRMDLNLNTFSSLAETADTYDIVKVSSFNIGELVLELLRVKPDPDGSLDFTVATPVR